MRAASATEVAAAVGRGFSAETIEALAAKGRLRFDWADGGHRVYDLDEVRKHLGLAENPSPAPDTALRQAPDGSWWMVGPDGRRRPQVSADPQLEMHTTTTGARPNKKRISPAARIFGAVVALILAMGVANSIFHFAKPTPGAASDQSASDSNPAAGAFCSDLALFLNETGPASQVNNWGQFDQNMAQLDADQKKLQSDAQAAGDPFLSDMVNAQTTGSGFDTSEKTDCAAAGHPVP